MRKPGVLKPLKGIVFDMDGTLVDSLVGTFDAFNHAIGLYGMKPMSGHEILDLFHEAGNEAYARLVGHENSVSCHAAWREYTDANMGRIPLHEGIGDLLETLKSQGVPISIFTGRAWDTTQIILKHHGLLDRFITIVSNDHVQQPKPSAEGLHLCLERMKLEPADVLMVGDSWQDMCAARAAGSHGVAALWDLLADRKLLAPYEPKHWAEKPAQLLEHWERA